MGLSLLAICVCAFVGVFIVLVFLALVMQIIMSLFPAKTLPMAPDEAPMVAAIVSAYARGFPGARICHMEEINNIIK
ncbi:MAG: hypothetical protein JW821_02305 [Deltaproteobacteria bacterium]|nr:hypothetical protein [Deltaproteobacteria bacterium]